MNITIYGRPDCENCAQARAVLVGAEYKHHHKIFNDFDSGTAVEVTTATKGELPIIVAENGDLRLVLGVGLALSTCEGGKCNIGERHENHRDQE